MNEILPSDVLQRLDERHEQLLAELDVLNERLESALGACAKPTCTEQASHTLAATELDSYRHTPSIAGGRDGRSC
jgi:hypothetical protein